MGIREMFHRRPETRESGFTSLVLAGLQATVSGTTGNVLTTGAAEVVSGIWARALAAARIDGTDALTARVRHRIGRDLIRTGNSVHLVETGGGNLRLVPVASYSVREAHRYDIEVPQPPGMVRKVSVARDGVLHCRWAEDPLTPWLGTGPLSATLLSRLAGNVEAKMCEELKVPTAHLLPVPVDPGDHSLDSLRTDIGAAKGGAVLLEGTSGGWEAGRQEAGTRNDWRAEKMGPDVPEQLRLLARDVLNTVALAAGVPLALVSPDATATGAREGFRFFVMASVEPIADLIAEEASAVLETDISFDFRHLWAHDLAGRAGAFQKLVGGGMDVEKAVQVAGLMVDG